MDLSILWGNFETELKWNELPGGLNTAAEMSHYRLWLEFI